MSAETLEEAGYGWPAERPRHTLPVGAVEHVDVRPVELADESHRVDVYGPDGACLLSLDPVDVDTLVIRLVEARRAVASGLRRIRHDEPAEAVPPEPMS